MRAIVSIAHKHQANSLMTLFCLQAVDGPFPPLLTASLPRSTKTDTHKTVSEQTLVESTAGAIVSTLPPNFTVTACQPPGRHKCRGKILPIITIGWAAKMKKVDASSEAQQQESQPAPGNKPPAPITGKIPAPNDVFTIRYRGATQTLTRAQLLRGKGSVLTGLLLDLEGRADGPTRDITICSSEAEPGYGGCGVWHDGTEDLFKVGFESESRLKASKAGTTDDPADGHAVLLLLITTASLGCKPATEPESNAVLSA